MSSYENFFNAYMAEMPPSMGPRAPSGTSDFDTDDDDDHPFDSFDAAKNWSPTSSVLSDSSPTVVHAWDVHGGSVRAIGVKE